MIRAAAASAFAVLAFACALPGPAVHRLPTPAFVVSAIDLPLDADTARATILAALGVARERDDPFYRSHGFRSGTSGDAWVPLLAEDASHAVFGRNFFADPANVAALYVHAMGVAVVSSQYATQDGPVRCTVAFALTTEALDGTHARVTVRALEGRLFSGSEFNAHALGWVPRAGADEPSRNDAYRLLAYVAHAAGVDLPSLDP